MKVIRHGEIGNEEKLKGDLNVLRDWLGSLNLPLEESTKPFKLRDQQAMEDFGMSGKDFK